jgi:hypothetical protein
VFGSLKGFNFSRAITQHSRVANSSFLFGAEAENAQSFKATPHAYQDGRRGL